MTLIPCYWGVSKCLTFHFLRALNRRPLWSFFARSWQRWRTSVLTSAVSGKRQGRRLLVLMLRCVWWVLLDVFVDGWLESATCNDVAGHLEIGFMKPPIVQIKSKVRQKGNPMYFGCSLCQHWLDRCNGSRPATATWGGGRAHPKQRIFLRNKELDKAVFTSPGLGSCHFQRIAMCRSRSARN